VFGLLALIASYAGVSAKASAFQDWKGAAKSLVENASGRHLYFVLNPAFISNPPEISWGKQRELLANFYIKRASHNRLHARPYVIGQTIIEKPALVLFGHNQAEFENLRREMEKLGAVQIFPTSKLDRSHWSVAGVYLVE
jgi:hypothetical protein